MQCIEFEDNDYKNLHISQHAGKKFKHNAFVYFLRQTRNWTTRTTKQQQPMSQGTFLPGGYVLHINANMRENSITKSDSMKHYCCCS